MLFAGGAEAAPDQAQLARGEKVYLEKCALCHQPNGQGAPPAFPPLAGSEWLSTNRPRAIRVVCEGLAGPITVKSQTFSNTMPAQILDDAQVADVLTYAANGWGNKAAAFTRAEVARARATSRFKTYDALLKATAYQPLPKPPAGWTLREVVQLPEFFVRMASDGRGETIYLLAQSGHIYTLDLASGALARIIAAEDYLGGVEEHSTMGMMLDRENRLWITSNQKTTNDRAIYTNEVVIWRTNPLQNGGTDATPMRWFTHRYPYGIGPFNHGVTHLAFGPDGFLYVSSGSRTDGGENGNDPHYFQGGEVETTACLWRFDPKANPPELTVYARGIRNPYGFAWDSEGNLFSFSNGPDCDAPEEMDFVAPGKHYGFPFQFADWAVKPGFPYKHTPPPPAGVSFTWPVENIGPDGGFREGTPCRTFSPHSSPGGAIWCGDEFPELLRGSFLMTRFGNLLAKPEDSGFDLLSVRPRRKPDGTWQASVHTILAPLGRPVDVHRLPGGRALILEYTRPMNFKEGLGWLPGRIIELAPALPP